MRKAKRYSHPLTNHVTISIRRNVWGHDHSLIISRIAVKIGAGVLTLALIAAGYFTYQYFQLSYDRAHIAEIKMQNLEQERQVKAMQDRLDRLKESQKKITEEQNKLKKIMGYEPNRPLSKATPSRGGQGGGEYDDEDSNLPLEFLAVTGELSEELDITGWEANALQSLWEHDPDRFLSLPSQYPIETADLSSDYGVRKNPFRSRRGEVHHGLDFSGDVGNKVYAAGKGTVIYAGWDADYGRLIKIDHGNGLVSWYGHNYRLLVKKGDEVERGQNISLMGSSGRSTGPHVHFAIQKSGEFISPWTYLP
ncbi:MAG: M23 family metallopeptidase [Methylocystaceae bacterium]